jgi:tRNA A37 threonylcarbamoyladenosine modification protein TsaB
MYLAIDMSESQQIHLVLFDECNRTDTHVEGKNADVLTVFDEFLTSQTLTPSELSGIAVVMGEGSFTSTRLAATVANTCQFVLGTPLVSIHPYELEDTMMLAKRCQSECVNHFLSPTYSGLPRIHNA